MRILWIGPLFSESSIASRPAVSAAAAKWTQGLLKGFKELGADVFCITHCYEQLWPKGEMLPGNKRDFDDSIDFQSVNYLNLPLLKDRFLSVAYKKAVKKQLKYQHYDFAFCYNTLHTYHVAAMKTASQLGIKTIPIILDVLADPRNDNWQALLRQTSYADGVVFLSKWAADNYPGHCPSHHMEGGCTRWLGNADYMTRSPKIVVHAGGVDFRRGGNFFPKVISKINRSDIRFVFCGKCDMSHLSAELRNDPRVSFPGFLSPQELDELYDNASVFLNAKDPEDGENIFNFPSKVSNYLPYGKPIVSTWLGSFPDDYRQVISFPEDNTPEKYAEKICEVADWSSDQCKDHYSVVKEWFIRKKLWEKQVKSLLDWSQCLVSSKKGQ
jgi:glycosyltransferase involved in cell wall biosynthesis